MPMSLTSTSGSVDLMCVMAASAFGASLTCAPASARMRDDQRARIGIVFHDQHAHCA